MGLVEIVDGRGDWGREVGGVEEAEVAGAFEHVEAGAVAGVHGGVWVVERGCGGWDYRAPSNHAVPGLGRIFCVG